ncbi:sulfite oxidase [Photobacterium sp. CCB-ST2H9]|uniref:sulfite oxidase n=1 Tax=Photobacterium sp. CCB-ST2H9 TaxID=2912855 RepID=UPI0020039289|nr:sulfite oxidase [Photobacterium sp. CCB-ST2H9]UTM59520.1 sulfite oxidase [Photobacterium sp. CCB-ST2H9]
MPKDLSHISITRRRFSALTGLLGLVFGFAPGMLSRAIAQVKETADKIIHGKSSEMIIHNAKLGVTETPLELLRKYKHTPKEILFSRYHFPHEGEAAWYGTTEAPPAKLVENWTIRIDGLVKRPRTVTIAELQAMPQEQRISVLQCAGNGRSFYAAKQKVSGGQWQNGGMGNVVWEGVPLKPFLESLEMEPSLSARWLTAEGWDQPATRAGTDFAKSYLIDDEALDHAILALKMNGEPIPAIHGGPVRLIIPGFYGNMNVKLLTVLLFAAEQSPSTYQSVGYRMPLAPVEPDTFGANDYTLENSRPTYGHAIKSVIFSPLPSDSPKSGMTEITGVAFNDGMAPITSVEVSTDSGKSWHTATLEKPESPWAWHYWSVKLQVGAGEQTLMSRATDALGRTQPIDGLARWNPRGYEWNGVERSAVKFS